MEDKMKNMVILKNIPSNIVEEAIVILKPNAKVKSADFSENNIVQEENKQGSKRSCNQYIINEAESIVANYVTKIENKNKIKAESDILKKYKLLKWISGLLVIMSIANYIV